MKHTQTGYGWMKTTVTSLLMAGLFGATSVAIAGQDKLAFEVKMPPDTILGLAHHDTEHAHIYSRGSVDDLTAVVDAVVQDIAALTDQSIPKGFIIEVDMDTTHPIIAMSQHGEKLGEEEIIEAFKQGHQDAHEKGNTTLENLLCFTSLSMPYPWFFTLAYCEQVENDVSLYTAENFQAAASNDKGDISPEWIVCVPTKERSAYTTKKSMPKMMKSQMGWVKYYLIRPFLGSLKKKAKNDWEPGFRTTLFEEIVDRLEVSDEEKNAWKAAYKKEHKAMFTGMTTWDI